MKMIDLKSHECQHIKPTFSKIIKMNSVLTDFLPQTDNTDPI